MEAGLHHLLSHLSTCTEPVSFIDALLLVRQVRRMGDLDDVVVATLMRLHERPELTLGGREVLGDFLRAYAQRLAKERALAERPVKLTDSGKTARARVGRAIDLALDNKVPSRWQVTELRGPGEIADKTPAEAQRSGSAQRLILRSLGLVVLHMLEPSDGKRAARRFELRVVVEKAQ